MTEIHRENNFISEKTFLITKNNDLNTISVGKRRNALNRSLVKRRHISTNRAAKFAFLMVLCH